ncbi:MULTISPECIES: glutathione S-transferase family protein [unclassified Methylobacterium]|uniref:glutathione S-transferase family protein n=1 Tax=unclassified Methylobacterium TaxID=2615210 RepID=UPI0006F71648|nr:MULTISPECIES: glutathione S-transferase family protein [unclassified Methylobacterium]KQP07956.1 glutathionyl-hydroquinone reductase YqjG [Methylobacterium sp. Leaf99]KQP40359.1 glutathionyl-hydroquinone reductase YqjG [Methylobacterium sp. Leaf106]
MGELIGGVWRTGGIESVLSDGTLRRPPSVFRDRVTADDGPFRAEAGRYHLYVSLACPWAHRTLIMRSLKGLAPMVGLSVVHWLMGEDGWTFAPGPGVVPDTVNGVTALHQLYTLADPNCTTRVTVPVLWDKATGRIVSNESAEILRMFIAAFDGLGATAGDYYPEAHRAEIDAVNERVYANLNNGVYRAGFATTQAAYEAAIEGVFDTLDWLEERLAGQRFLVGDALTEADIRLFTTLVRFNAVYHGHFKCNRRALVTYPALWAYTRDLYQHPAIRPTVDLGHIKGHYYGSHPWLNPSRIVPLGPDLDFDAPSGRERLSN